MGLELGELWMVPREIHFSGLAEEGEVGEEALAPRTDDSFAQELRLLTSQGEIDLFGEFIGRLRGWPGAS